MNEAVMLGWRRFFHLQKCVLQARHRRGVVRGDVGIQGRLKVVKTSSPDLNEIDEEILENLEPDFVNQKFSQEFDREMSRMKKTVDYSRVERKHFKSPTNPNMLTWAEKEQIRLLHQEQPEVWTVEKLSKSYPATKNIIQKIIMSRWRPRNEERIAKHDRSVLANWKSLREGKLSVPDEEFERHLKNFTTRENLLPPAQEYGVTKQIVKPAMPGGEFSQIIESYRNSGKSATCEHDHKVDELKAEFETQTRWGKSPRADSLYTLEELRKTVESDLAATRKQRSELEEAFLHRVTAPEKIKPVTPIRGDEVIKESMKDTCIVTGSASDKLVEAKDDYPNRISIPEDKRKTTNGLYRVRDCFYDEDGEFLYRVPGMKH